MFYSKQRTALLIFVLVFCIPSKAWAQPSNEIATSTDTTISYPSQIRLTNTYLIMNVGIANTNTSKNKVQGYFDRAGISNTNIQSIDRKRSGFGLGVGYKFNQHWYTEVAHLDLGQVDVEFSTDQTINQLEKIHPESGQGLTFSGIYHQALLPKTQWLLRFGLFDWHASYDTSFSAKDSDSGTDIFIGTGLNYQLKDKLKITSELQYFDFDRENTIYLNVGLKWFFART